MDKKTFVIVAAGPGLGNHVAKEFGNNGFRVILIARNENKLKEYVDEFNKNNIEADYRVADCSKIDTLSEALKDIQNIYGAIDVFVYNGAMLQATKPLELSLDNLMDSYQVDVASALHCVHQIIEKQLEQKNGTILFTGGGLGKNPSYEFTTISIGKSALRALALTLNQELNDKGIYVGIVNIFGNIEKNTEYDPAIIAKTYYQMYLDRKLPEIDF